MYSRVDILQHLSSYNQILLEQAVSKVILANYGLVMAGVRTVKHIVVWEVQMYMTQAQGQAVLQSTYVGGWVDDRLGMEGWWRETHSRMTDSIQLDLASTWYSTNVMSCSPLAKHSEDLI